MVDAVEFSYVMAGQFPRGDDMGRRIEESLEQVVLAREAGFEMLWATQHFLADFQFLQPVPFLSRLLAVAGEMRIGTAVMLAPLYPPVLLAEEAATLDALAGGRFTLGLGAGYRSEEFDAFQIPRQQRGQRLEETVEILRALWAGESVTHDGRFFRLDAAQLSLHPPQGADLPVWIGATGPLGIQRAARIGDEWLCSPEATIGQIQERQSIYRAALSGVDDERIYPILREGFVGHDRDHALARSSPALKAKYEAYARWGHAAEASFGSMVEDVFLLGSPQDVIEQIERYIEQTGTAHIGFRMQWPGLSQSEVLDSVLRFGETVVPHFRGRNG